MEPYDVIIAGAGPVGLFLACELRLANLNVLVLEAQADPSSALKRLPFGRRGLWGPSVEAFYRRGLLDEVSAEGRAGPGPQPGARRGPAGHFAGIQFDHENIDASRWIYRLAGPGDGQVGATMEHLERVLGERARASGVVIERGQAVDGFEASETDVVVRAGDRRVRAGWLVGCDGGRSAVASKRASTSSAPSRSSPATP